MKKKREMNENSLKNLKKFSKDYQPSPERKSEGQLKANAERKTMKATLDYLLEKEITNSKGEKATTKEAIMTATIKKALHGDIKAIQFIRDTIGETPVAKQEILSANLNMQKIFITDEQKKEVDKHIEDIING